MILNTRGTTRVTWGLGRAFRILSRKVLPPCLQRVAPWQRQTQDTRRHLLAVYSIPYQSGVTAEHSLVSGFCLVACLARSGLGTQHFLRHQHQRGQAVERSCWRFRSCCFSLRRLVPWSLPPDWGPLGPSATICSINVGNPVFILTHTNRGPEMGPNTRFNPTCTATGLRISCHKRVHLVARQLRRRPTSSVVTLTRR